MGINDALADGDQSSTVTFSVVEAASDDAFDPLADQTVSVTTTDDDSAGISVNPTSGLVTTEAGGTTQFSVVITDGGPLDADGEANGVIRDPVALGRRLSGVSPEPIPALSVWAVSLLSLLMLMLGMSTLRQGRR